MWDLVRERPREIFLGRNILPGMFWWVTANEEGPKCARSMGQRLNTLKILLFPMYFSGLQDTLDLSQEFLHNSEATSVIPACWQRCPGRAVHWGRIAGGASLIPAREERLMQKRAGEGFPSPYGSWTFGNWICGWDKTGERKGTGAVSSDKVKGRVLYVEGDTVFCCLMQLLELCFATECACCFITFRKNKQVWREDSRRNREIYRWQGTNMRSFIWSLSNS